MNRDDLIRALRHYCRKRGVPFEVNTARGRGSHYRVSVGQRWTIVQTKLDPHNIRTILKQLDVDPAEL